MSGSRSAGSVADHPAATHRTRTLTLAAACLALFAIFLDNTIVNVAIPAIQRDLGSALAALVAAAVQRAGRRPAAPAWAMDPATPAGTSNPAAPPLFIPRPAHRPVPPTPPRPPDSAPPARLAQSGGGS